MSPPGKAKKNGKEKAKNGNGANLGFETQLFLAADKLSGNLEPSDYKHVALGLIFLKYISDAFAAKHAALLADDPDAARARMRLLVKKILRKYGYPPDLQDAAVQTVLQQAEGLSAEWAG